MFLKPARRQYNPDRRQERAQAAAYQSHLIEMAAQDISYFFGMGRVGIPGMALPGRSAGDRPAGGQRRRTQGFATFALGRLGWLSFGNPPQCLARQLIERDPAVVDLRQELLLHPTGPKVQDVVSDPRDGIFTVILGAKEIADVVRHLRQVG